MVAYLPEVRPTWFFAVPRIWEKLKAAIEAGDRGRAGRGAQEGVEWALDVGLRKVAARAGRRGGPGELPAEHAKADELVLSKIRERLGLDEVEAVNVGAAPTPREVLEFFHAIGDPAGRAVGHVRDHAAPAPATRPTGSRSAPSGPPSPGVELKLADDGEVLIRGAA